MFWTIFFLSCGLTGAGLSLALSLTHLGVYGIAWGIGSLSAFGCSWGEWRHYRESRGECRRR